jgi:hypothetical protein
MLNSMTSPNSRYQFPKTIANKVALYVNIPFCQQACTFCHYLPNLSFKHHKVPDQYFQLLLKQISHVSQMLPTYTDIDCVYIGGGTPSLLTDEQVNAILENSGVKKSAEISMEVHPASWSTSIARRGLCNRISLGVQSFSPSVLATWNRQYYQLDTIQAIFAEIRSLSPGTRLNIDLLFSIELNEADVMLAKSLNPDSITIYPKTGKKKPGDIAKIYRELDRARHLLDNYTPLAQRSFIFLRDHSSLCKYSKLEHEILGDVIGVGDFAISYIGSDSFLSRVESSTYRFEERWFGEREIRTFLQSAVSGTPEWIWRKVAPDAEHLLIPMNHRLWRLPPENILAFDAYLQSKNHPPQWLSVFRRSVLFGTDDHSLLLEAIPEF